MQKSYNYRMYWLSPRLIRRILAWLLFSYLFPFCCNLVTEVKFQIHTYELFCYSENKYLWHFMVSVVHSSARYDKHYKLWTQSISWFIPPPTLPPPFPPPSTKGLFVSMYCEQTRKHSYKWIATFNYIRFGTFVSKDKQSTHKKQLNYIHILQNVESKATLTLSIKSVNEQEVRVESLSRDLGKVNLFTDVKNLNLLKI